MEINNGNEYTYLYAEGKPFAIHKQSTDELFYLHLDNQGSLMVISNTDGELVENRSGVYAERSRSNAWGRPRDPNNWSYNITGFGGAGNGITMRGYTMHEHLEMFSLINMNGRLYDPVLGRMLSPDNYIQSPDNTQSYNRYSYCVNNPLKYTDPSGNIFGTLLTGVVDFVSSVVSTSYNFLVTGFVKGGFDPTSASARANAWLDYGANTSGTWTSFDPSAKWSKTNKAWGIDKGLLQTDPNMEWYERVWEITSRFTWQAPQTVLGNLNAHQYNIRGEVEDVDYFGGATVVRAKGRWGGITIGNYIVGDETIRASADNDLLRHEYGHYIQSQRNGPTYLLKYGIPSLLSAAGVGNHSDTWTEGDANERAYQYFNEHYGVTESSGGKTSKRWNSIYVRGNIRNTEWWEYGITLTPYWYLVPLFNLK